MWLTIEQFFWIFLRVVVDKLTKMNHSRKPRILVLRSVRAVVNLWISVLDLGCNFIQIGIRNLCNGIILEIVLFLIGQKNGDRVLLFRFDAIVLEGELDRTRVVRSVTSFGDFELTFPRHRCNGRGVDGEQQTSNSQEAPDASRNTILVDGGCHFRSEQRSDFLVNIEFLKIRRLKILNHGFHLRFLVYCCRGQSPTAIWVFLTWIYVFSTQNLKFWVHGNDSSLNP